MKTIYIEEIQRVEAPRQASMMGGGESGSYGAWAKVIDRHSEDHTVDVITDRGLVVSRVPVASRDWVFSSDSTTGGTRDLPPKDAYVFVLLPSGMFETGFVLCSGFPRRTDPKVQRDFLVEGKESEARTTMEGGWTETTDKNTGDYTLEDDDEFVLRVKRSTKTVELEDWHGNTTKMDAMGIKITDSFGNEVTMSATGVEIKTVNGKISGGALTVSGVAAPSGSGPFCALPMCFLTGAPHVGTTVVGT